MPLSPGDILNGHYRIEAEIGRGAYGRVYRARDTKLDRPVAIKELAKGVDELGSSIFSDYVRRFEREARVQAGFNHPNIVHVYELIQESADRLYLVMELVDGESLRDLLQRRGQLPINEAVRITADILAGLAVVHADPRDIVHRDIKPSNVLLTKAGQAKLADFGLAQVGDESMRSGAGQPHPGTPSYMSPEQETTSAYLYPASDLFSIGCVLFEMLTGVAYKRAKKERKGLAELRTDAPPWLSEITAAALAKDPNDRPANAAEMGRLLAEARTKVEAGAAAQAQQEAQRRAKAEAEREVQAEAEAARRAKQEQEQREAAERARLAAQARAAAFKRARPWVIGAATIFALVLVVWHPWMGSVPAAPVPTQTPVPIQTPRPVAAPAKASEPTKAPAVPEPTKAPTQITIPTTVPEPIKRSELAGATATTAAPSTAPQIPPTLTPKPATLASVPSPGFTVKGSLAVNVRSGPGTDYDVIGQLAAGSQHTVTGRTAANDWWRFTYDGKPAWVSDSVVNVNSQTAGAPVVATLPTPKPREQFGSTATLGPVPATTQSLLAPQQVGPLDGETVYGKVELSWEPVSGSKHYLLQTRSERAGQTEWQNWGPYSVEAGIRVILSFSDSPAYFSIPGTVYSWRVAAQDAIGNLGAFSAERRFVFQREQQPPSAGAWPARTAEVGLSTFGFMGVMSAGLALGLVFARVVDEVSE